MRVMIFVQARMGSTRLPGKVLKQVLGRPLLSYLVERLKDVKNAQGFLILTTISPKDDVIVEFCEKEKIPYFRGPENDVLARYYQAALKWKPDAIVRTTADCPLTDPEIIDQIISAFVDAKTPLDYLSNVLERSYPKGLDCEIFSFKALERAFKETDDPYNREHVSPYFYRNPEQFSIKNIALPKDYSKYRWTVDTKEDFELIEKMIEDLYPKNPHFRFHDMLKLLEKHPEWSHINGHLA